MGLDKNDRRVGHIFVYAAKEVERETELGRRNSESNSDEIHVEASHGRCATREEQRDVYFSRIRFQGRPFYFTHSGNRVLIMDPEKIVYDPGQDPQSRYLARKAHLEEKERRRQERRRERRMVAEREEVGKALLETFPTRPVRPRKPKKVHVSTTSNDPPVTADQKVGVFSTRQWLKPIKEEPAPIEEPVEEEEVPEEEPKEELCRIPNLEKRLVYCDPKRFHGYPFYLTNSGNPILVFNMNRIQCNFGELEVVEDEDVSGLPLSTLVRLFCLTKWERGVYEKMQFRRDLKKYQVGTIRVRLGNNSPCENNSSATNETPVDELEEESIDELPEEKLPAVKEPAPKTLMTSTRDVYALSDGTKTIYYYMAKSGNKILIINPEHIQFLDQYVLPSKNSDALKYLQDLGHPREEAELEAKESQFRKSIEDAEGWSFSRIENLLIRSASPPDTRPRKYITFITPFKTPPHVFSQLIKPDADQSSLDKSKKDGRSYMLLSNGRKVYVKTNKEFKAEHKAVPNSGEKKIRTILDDPVEETSDDDTEIEVEDNSLQPCVIGTIKVALKDLTGDSKELVQDVFQYPLKYSGRAFYLTKSGNKVFVMNKERIRFLDAEDNEVEVSFSWSGTGDYDRNTTKPNDQDNVGFTSHHTVEQAEIEEPKFLFPPDEEADVTSEPQKLVAIKIKVPQKNKKNGALTFKRKYLDVFRRRNESNIVEYYYCTGKGDNSFTERLIRYRLPDGSFPSVESSDDEAVDVPVDIREELKVGTIEIPMRTDLPSKKESESDDDDDGGSQETEKPRSIDVRSVYRSPDILANAPFFLTYTGNPILVIRPERIQYLPGKEPSPSFDPLEAETGLE